MYDLKLISQTMWSFTLPYLFNPNAANLQAKVAFLFGGTSILSCVYLFFCHPETKGRSFEEIDELFHKQVPARKFGSYVTDIQLRNREVKEQADQSAMEA
jgi:SP family general alpha glucoside:H+ symporter-like MFS transporter